MRRFSKSANVNVWTFSNLYEIGAESTGVCSICYENGVIHHINLPCNEEFIRFWEEDDEIFFRTVASADQKKMKQN